MLIFLVVYIRILQHASTIFEIFTFLLSQLKCKLGQMYASTILAIFDFLQPIKPYLSTTVSQ